MSIYHPFKISKNFSLLLLILFFSACSKNPCSFNIDKHEILTGIDIPKSIGGACLPNEEQGFKISVWQLDTLALYDDYHGLSDYIRHFKFVELTGELNTGKLNLLPEKYRESLTEGKLFYKFGEKWDQKWIMIINRNTGVLFGEIIYLTPD